MFLIVYIVYDSAWKKNVQNVVASPHTEIRSVTISCVTAFDQEKQTLFQQPPYSPGLTPCEIYLFKTQIPFESNISVVEEIQETVTRQQISICKRKFRECFHKWKRYKVCEYGR